MVFFRGEVCFLFLPNLLFMFRKSRRKRRQNKGIRDFSGSEFSQTDRTFGRLSSTQIIVFPRLHQESQDTNKGSSVSTRRKTQRTRVEEVYQDVRDQTGSREPWPLADHEVPEWMPRARERLLAHYPGDSFIYVQERNQIKIRCIDCTDRTFMPGPGLTLNNFEAHIRTPKHRSKVNERFRREANKSSPS
jgi:hypothetical protein